MGRTDKLFQRLDELEVEYRRLAAHEFARWVRNPGYTGRSLFLVDKIPFLHYFKYPAASERERRDKILHVENETEALRIKLDQPMSQSPVHAVRVAAAQICAAHESGEGTELMFVKALLRDLGYEKLAEDRP